MVGTCRLGTAQKSLGKCLKTRAFQHHFSVPKTQKHMLAPYFLLFFLVEKLVPVRLLPTKRATSLVVVYILPFLRKVRKETSVCLPITKTN